nr:hypothetical protein DBV21_21715 [Pseudomonas congelans]
MHALRPPESAPGRTRVTRASRNACQRGALARGIEHHFTVLGALPVRICSSSGPH